MYMNNIIIYTKSGKNLQGKTVDLKTFLYILKFIKGLYAMI